MPIYEYNCPKCGNQLEVLVRKASDVPGKCPKCGHSKLTKGFSTFAVSAPDPTAHCETCPTAPSSCSSGVCSSGKCPYSG